MHSLEASDNPLEQHLETLHGRRPDLVLDDSFVGDDVPGPAGRGRKDNTVHPLRGQDLLSESRERSVGERRSVESVDSLPRTSCGMGTERKGGRMSGLHFAGAKSG